MGHARRARRRSKGRARRACRRGCKCSESRRSIFLTEASAPRRGRRVLAATLGRHHKPFGSARTARGLRALDLAGALHALRRAERRGAREKSVDQDRRTIHDPTHQHDLRRQRGLEWIWVLRNVSRTARESTCPAGIESSSRRFDGGLQNGILAFRPPWYPTEPPRALRRATQARWVASARSTSGSICVFRWMPPPLAATDLRAARARPPRARRACRA